MSFDFLFWHCDPSFRRISWTSHFNVPSNQIAVSVRAGKPTLESSTECEMQQDCTEKKNIIVTARVTVHENLELKKS